MCVCVRVCDMGGGESQPSRKTEGRTEVQSLRDTRVQKIQSAVLRALIRDSGALRRFFSQVVAYLESFRLDFRRP